MEVKPYLELCGRLARQDRGLREKVLSLEEAAALVHDGDSVGNRRKHTVTYADDNDLGTDPCPKKGAYWGGVPRRGVRRSVLEPAGMSSQPQSCFASVHG